MSRMPSFSFTSPLWIYPGDAAWHFVTVPPEVSDEIADLVEPYEKRGFGSVRVEVRVGATRWSTSVFPDKKSGCYVLPMKKQVRHAEHLEVGDDVIVRLTVMPDR